MRIPIWTTIFVAVLLAACCSPVASRAQDARIAAGKGLFEKQWLQGEPATAGGDGLGPMFNHVSCVACHKQGGVGGGGPLEANAEMLSVLAPPFASAPQQREFLRKAASVHPSFATPEGDLNANVILHRFSTDSRYNALRQAAVGSPPPFNPSPEQLQALQDDLRERPTRTVPNPEGLALVQSFRNTPALFGAGLIDRISDAVILSQAKEQERHPEISGRPSAVGLRKLGRFGWKGQIEHLRDFVAGACANELGLESPSGAQSGNPLTPFARATANDLSADQIELLTEFCASLPSPRVVRPEDEDLAKLAERGVLAFRKVGCADCHVENVGPIKGLYSDLLLHDLGPGLYDPVPAKPHLVAVDQSAVRRTTLDDVLAGRAEIPTRSKNTQVKPIPHYYGGSIQAFGVERIEQTATGLRVQESPEGMGVRNDLVTRYAALPTNAQQEWRTPPLWGLRDSAPYLHDGRAETVIEAIALHGGEAQGSVERYFALPAVERTALLAFLDCLCAP